MSELIQKNDNRATIRWKLLTGASALALTAYVSSTAFAKADDADRPQVWIELGGQLSRLQDKQEIYSPLFLTLEPTQFTSPAPSMQPPRYGLDTSGAISFQPEGSDWILSASIRYGRSGSGGHFHQQTYPTGYPFFLFGNFARTIEPLAARFIDTKAKESEIHTIVDFAVGKDVGLGLFGHEGSSSLNLGVRIAQFTSKARASLKEDPDWQFSYKYASYPSFGIVHSKFPIGQPYHSFAGEFRATRTFRGIGPSISWAASMPFAGNTQDGSLDLDLGLNAAFLFGRQKTQTHHQTTGRYHSPSGFLPKPHVLPITYQGPITPDHTRSRDVTVPNVGGSVGLSWHLQNFKASLGYKADFFLGAIDGGIDTRKSENRAFFGPYASISIGLGD